MNRKLVLVAVNAIVLVSIALLVLAFPTSFLDLATTNVVFWVVVVLGCLLESEAIQWVKRSKRSGTMDLLFIAFMLLFTLLLTGDLFTGVLGAFAVYLVVASLELKGHAVMNKVVLITAITYNVLFATSLVDFLVTRAGLPPVDLLDKTFALSLWLILGLGFAFFGRKYIVVWRFMSPQYITLALYFMAWLLVATAGVVTGIDIFTWIYPALIVANVFIYFTSGVLIDKFLGVKSVSSLDASSAAMLLDTVDRVKNRLGLKGKIKVGFGKYPIINAMAYGPFNDKRICIIAPDAASIPQDELDAIVAHELGHLQLRHPTWLLAINIVDIAARWVFGIPATYYDFMFGKKFVILGVDVGILGFIILNMAIFAFLYVFVRVMEANADLVVKRAGLGRSLAKALYNLESYYALGKQVGLNVVLLADEKLDENHQILNYIDAARALHRQLHVPPRSIAVSTLMNSHPPTFLRVASMLLPDEAGLGAWEETRVPLSLLRAKHVAAFSRRVAGVREALDAITRAKFQELFGHRTGGDLPRFMEGLRLHGNGTTLARHHVLAVDTLDKVATHVKVAATRYRDSISEPFEYFATRTAGGDSVVLHPSRTRFTILDTGHVYVAGKHEGRLVEVHDGVQASKIRCTLSDTGGTRHDVPIKDIKNQVTIDEVHGLRGGHFLVEHNEALEVHACTRIDDGQGIHEVVVHGSNTTTGLASSFPMKRTVVDRATVLVAFHRDDAYKPRYKALLGWCASGSSWVKIFLKKPVNNEHHCRVTRVSDDMGGITCVDVFGEELSLDFKDMDYMVWDSGMLVFKDVAQLSAMQKLARAIGVARKDVAWVPRR